MMMSQDDLEQQAHQLKRHQVELPQPLHEYVWLVHSRYWDPVDLICMSSDFPIHIGACLIEMLEQYKVDLIC